MRVRNRTTLAIATIVAGGLFTGCAGSRPSQFAYARAATGFAASDGMGSTMLARRTASEGTAFARFDGGIDDGIYNPSINERTALVDVDVD